MIGHTPKSDKKRKSYGLSKLTKFADAYARPIGRALPDRARATDLTGQLAAANCPGIPLALRSFLNFSSISAQNHTPTNIRYTLLYLSKTKQKENTQTNK